MHLKQEFFSAKNDFRHESWQGEKRKEGRRRRVRRRFSQVTNIKMISLSSLSGTSGGEIPSSVTCEKCPNELSPEIEGKRKNYYYVEFFFDFN